MRFSVLKKSQIVVIAASTFEGQTGDFSIKFDKKGTGISIVQQKRESHLQREGLSSKVRVQMTPTFDSASNKITILKSFPEQCL